MTEEQLSAQEQPVWENVSHIDRELYFEAVRGLSRGWKNRMLALAGVLAAVVGLLMGWTALLALGLLIAAGFSLSPLLVGWRDYQKLLQRHPKGQWDKTVRFYRDRVETSAPGGEATVMSYRDIRREVETQRLYILDFGKKGPSTLFRKDGFRSGSLEEVKAFLLERQRAAYDEDTSS